MPVIGFGIAGSSNYNDDGVNFSASFGTTGEGLPALNSSLYYQAKLNDSTFITLGFMAGIFSYYGVDCGYDYYYDDGIFYCEETEFAMPYILPMLSIDIRF